MEIFLITGGHVSVSDLDLTTSRLEAHARSPREFAIPITLGEDKGMRTIPPRTPDENQ